MFYFHLFCYCIAKNVNKPVSVDMMVCCVCFDIIFELFYFILFYYFFFGVKYSLQHYQPLNKKSVKLYILIIQTVIQNTQQFQVYKHQINLLHLQVFFFFSLVLFICLFVLCSFFEDTKTTQLRSPSVESGSSLDLIETPGLPDDDFDLENDQSDSDILYQPSEGMFLFFEMMNIKILK